MNGPCYEFKYFMRTGSNIWELVTPQNSRDGKDMDYLFKLKHVSRDFMMMLLNQLLSLKGGILHVVNIK